MSRMLDQAEWPSWICDDLDPVLKAISARHAISVTGVYVDLKAAMAEVYLAGGVSPQAFESLRQEFAPNARLRFVEGSAACSEHYCSVRLTAPAADEAQGGGTLWRRIKEFIGKGR